MSPPLKAPDLSIVSTHFPLKFTRLFIYYRQLFKSDTLLKIIFLVVYSCSLILTPYL
jgi:hypothetical protein